MRWGWYKEGSSFAMSGYVYIKVKYSLLRSMGNDYMNVFGYLEKDVLLFKESFSNSYLLSILDLCSKFTFMYIMCTLSSYSILRILFHKLWYHCLDTFKMSHIVIFTTTILWWHFRIENWRIHQGNIRLCTKIFRPLFITCLQLYYVELEVFY